MPAKKKATEEVKAVKETKVEKKKEPKMVRMYHVNDSVIDIPESQVENHKKAGWRLEK